MTKLHVIVATYNRSNVTVHALTSLNQAARTARVEYDVTLFDDGSSDDTVASARQAAGSISILRGDGSAFWAQSMERAERAVLDRPDVSDDDWLMWFNDDVELLEDGLDTMFAAGKLQPSGIVVGSTVDKLTGAVTYGGLRKRPGHPLAFDLVEPTRISDGVRVDSLNGNVVLVPIPVARALGSIDGGFSHAFADIDYGMRAAALGTPLWMADRPVGYCSRNPSVSYSSVRLAWRAYIGKKGAGNPSSLRRYLRRHSPRSWWIFFGTSYVLWWVRNLRPPSKARRTGS